MINKFLVSTLFISAFLAIFVYLTVRIFYILASQYSWFELVLSIIFLFAEAFIIIHSIGYFLNIFRIFRKQSTFTPEIRTPELKSFPPVAIVVASYKEPLDILEDTLVCFYNLSYPEKQLYFLDDTRYNTAWDTPEKMLEYRKSIEELCKKLEINLFRAKWHGAKAGMLNDFLQFLSGNNKEGFEFTSYDHKQHHTAKYLIIFDADMNPFPDFVEPLVSIMEEDPKLAFIQTPQYYSNFEFNRVARAAGLQQAIFYEYICEGKSLQGAMFCCGTNVIFRKEALLDVGGFDEVSVTEDFATSIKLHKRGWHSLYLNKVMAFGMGPEDLGAFFKQQFRWARGTLGVLKTLPKEMLENFNKFTIGQWWEYLLSSSHYLIGFVFFIMVVFPVIYIFFDLPSYLADPLFYFLAFVPYITLTMLIFILALKKRRYKTKDILFVLLMNAVTFPIFMKATLSSLFGIKSDFVITPKGGSTALSLSTLFPQVFMGLLCISAVTWGLMRLYFEREPFYALIINVTWTFYNFLMISTFLYFNHSEVECEASS